ncbi:phosphatidylserine decarboxylase [Bacillus rubiinfantis]|uniref:phosphatidylserine decarboxylase n=1 Tax=Bacillus rubiinfantis TaxID=1499680 RepID=UPI0005A81C74|nr:phosphatidylserine decarboxylase [Bacillus rubiinfantis]
MLQLVYRLLIELTNGRWSSTFLKRFTKSRLSRVVVPSFAKVYHINQAEMEKELAQYPTLHDLFVRKLKDDARKIDSTIDSVISPVDAVIEDIGTITETREMKVKDKVYSIEEMLGDEEILTKYQNGTYMILYLSPSHYHRIHSPVAGLVKKQWTLGSKSYPVNKWGLKYGVRTLAKNYRVMTEVQTNVGHVTIVKIGAMFVNSIETTYKGEKLEKGEELAYFTFGSTVVLLFEKGIFQVEDSIVIPHDIKMGEKIGRLIKNE